MRVGHSHAPAKQVEFIIANDSEVLSGAEDHLRDIWTPMAAISTRCGEVYPNGRQLPSNNKITDPVLTAHLSHLQWMCLGFSFERVKKCVNSRFDRFKAIKMKDLNPNHPFICVQEIILAIEGLFTRESGALFGKPMRKGTEAYQLLLTALRWAQ